MRKGILFGVLFMMIGFYSCNKTETPAKNDAAVLTLSNSLVVELVSITPCNDGGFVVGARSRKNSHMDFWILKYDNNFNLLWERLVGGPNDETLHKILIDRDDNILAGGESDGFGQDSFPLHQDKQNVLYFHYFDKNGNTKWETAYPFSDFNFSGGGWHKPIVTDMIEGNTTEFIITGKKPHFYNNRVGSVGITIKLTKSGIFSASYIIDVFDFSDATCNAVFKMDNTYSVFWNHYLSGGFMELDESAPSENEIDVDKSRAAQWDYYNLIPDNIAQLKMPLPNGTFSFNYFTANKAYRYSYDINSKHTTGNPITLDFEPLYSVNTTYDNHFILTDNTGGIYETDSEFKVLKEYTSNYKHDVLCKLYSGEYIGGYEANSTIYLTHFDTNGKIKSNE